ncbi:ParB/RepB/Spo0J family partition protein [Paraburkholderia sp. DHOC27]|uniref:ParB/RepB/Spo0J family partition protein n=1 Tax=Paraburkholderia sp. DHOC27 TaxID=2303330 RepID=UPI000E3E49DD|nr:ParB/RepB/Spo0J family partition protein [Paraburkholderia sp. DHOC27]RFU44463.1 ParB/RepB/Spo0J family partition protein [Paraburkholderia sp. DHOC27]
MSLKEKMAAKTAAIAGPSGNRPPASTAPKTGPGQFLAAMPILAEKEEELERANAALEASEATSASLREQLEQALSQGNPAGTAVMIPLSKLHEVPGRRRYMSPEKYAELRENIRNNDLINPVVVLPREDGDFDIWSGHHRTDAHRDDGRETVWCVLGKTSKASATAGAFYANLMQSDLTDYEKYVGFKNILAENPRLTQAELAEQSGVSAGTVSKLMAFEQLPELVLSQLKDHPALIGFNSGYALAVLTKEGKGEQVIAAVGRLAKGEIDQAQAVKQASATPVVKAKAPKATGAKIKVGKDVYCDLRTARNVVRLQFQSDEEAAAVQGEIKAVLEARAERLRAAQEK